MVKRRRKVAALIAGALALTFALTGCRGSAGYLTCLIFDCSPQLPKGPSVQIRVINPDTIQVDSPVDLYVEGAGHSPMAITWWKKNGSELHATLASELSDASSVTIPSEFEPASHTFTEGGKYVLRGYKFDGHNLIPLPLDSSLYVYPVGTEGPVARWAVTPTLLPSTGGTVMFDASTASGRTARITDYQWDFGDGIRMQTQLPTQTHLYLPLSTETRYTATVTVVDARARTSTVRAYITELGSEDESINRSLAAGDKYSVEFAKARVSTPRSAANFLTLTSNISVRARPKAAFMTSSATARKLLAGKWKSRFQTSVNLGTGKGTMVGTALVTAKGMTACFRVSAPVRGYHAKPGVLTLVGGKNLHGLKMHGTALIKAPKNRGATKISGRMAVGNGKVHKIPKGCGTSPTAR